MSGRPEGLLVLQRTQGTATSLLLRATLAIANLAVRNAVRSAGPWLSLVKSAELSAEREIGFGRPTCSGGCAQTADIVAG